MYNFNVLYLWFVDDWYCLGTPIPGCDARFIAPTAVALGNLCTIGADAISIVVNITVDGLFVNDVGRTLAIAVHYMARACGWDEGWLFGLGVWLAGFTVAGFECEPGALLCGLVLVCYMRFMHITVVLPLFTRVVRIRRWATTQTSSNSSTHRRRWTTPFVFIASTMLLCLPVACAGPVPPTVKEQPLIGLDPIHSSSWLAVACGVVASSAVILFALLGCISSGKKKKKTQQPPTACTHCGHQAGSKEREFWSQKDEMQLNIDQLGAVYTSLGQLVADIKGLESEVEALKKAKETSSNARWVQRNLIDPMERDLASAKARETKFVDDIIKLRNRFAEQAMPESKACAAEYAAIFEKESTGPDGSHAVATICSTVARLKAGLPPPPTDGTKASIQPEETVLVLQQTGVREAKMMYDAVEAALHAAGLDGTQLVGSSVCPKIKSAGRGFEKVYARWAGDFRAVTDWGRATICALTLVLLAQAIEVALHRLEELGYTVVGVKNTLDIAKDCTANGNYRNLMLNLKCPTSGHILELQFNVSSIEALKQGRGHIVFELLRRCGFSVKNAVVKGGWTLTMDNAIRCGRAVELNCEEANWTSDEAAALKDALGARGCRVSSMNGAFATGEGAGDMEAATASSATIKNLRYVLHVSYACVCFLSLDSFSCFCVVLYRPRTVAARCSIFCFFRNLFVLHHPSV